MLMLKPRQKKGWAGFTIVELLIVIVVIAILAAVSTVAYNGVRSRADDAHRVSDVDAVKKFLEMYHIDNGHYMKSDNFLNGNAAAALASGPLVGLPAEALRGPEASDALVSSWGQWYGNVQDGVTEYSIKSYTSTGVDCIGASFSNADCSRYELIYKSESDNTIKQIRSSHGW